MLAASHGIVDVVPVGPCSVSVNGGLAVKAMNDSTLPCAQWLTDTNIGGGGRRAPAGAVMAAIPEATIAAIAATRSATDLGQRLFAHAVGELVTTLPSPTFPSKTNVQQSYTLQHEILVVQMGSAGMRNHRQQRPARTGPRTGSLKYWSAMPCIQ